MFDRTAICELRGHEEKVITNTLRLARRHQSLKISKKREIRRVRPHFGRENSTRIWCVQERKGCYKRLQYACRTRIDLRRLKHSLTTFAQRKYDEEMALVREQRKLDKAAKRKQKKDEERTFQGKMIGMKTSSSARTFGPEGSSVTAVIGIDNVREWLATVSYTNRNRSLYFESGRIICDSSQ